MTNSIESDDKKFQIRATQEDQSRLKSLEFLLLAVGRQVTSEQLKTKETQNVQKIRDTLKTLKVVEDGENWTITTNDSKVSVNKNLFSFYRRDSSTAFPVQNNNAVNALKVLQELLGLQIESSPVSRNEKYYFLSQPQFLTRLYSYFSLILCLLSDPLNTLPTRNLLSINWAFYITFFVLAGFLKRRQNLILFGVCGLGSVFTLIISTFSAKAIIIPFLNTSSLYISTVLLIALNFMPEKVEYRKFIKNPIFYPPVLFHFFCVLGIFYIIIKNPGLILSELVQILFILAPFVSIRLFRRVESKIFRNYFTLSLFLVATYFLILKLQFEPLGQVILYSLIFTSTQLYELFHGTRLNYVNFLGRNAVLLAGVIV